MSLGKKIRLIRMGQGKSQEWLADATGLSQSYISALESGSKQNPTKITLDKIIEALGVPSEMLEEESVTLLEELLGLPDDILTWLAKEESSAYVFVAKELQDEGYSPQELKRLTDFLRQIKK